MPNDRIKAPPKPADSTIELKTVLDTVPAAVWIARDPQGEHIDSNRFGAEMLKQPTGSNVSVTAPEGDGPRNFRVMRDGRELTADELPIQQAARFGREVRNAEIDIAFDDGTVRHMLGNAAPIRDKAGKVRGSVGAFIDITERKRAVLGLRASEGKYRKLFENMTEEVHVWEVVREGDRIVTCRLADANPPALRTWKIRTVEEIRGKTLDEIFGAGTTDHYRAAAEHVFREGKPYAFTDYFEPFDRYFRYTFIPMGDMLVTTGADITEITKSRMVIEAQNMELREAAQRKDEFLALLSHELRNPLAPILNATRIIKGAGAEGDVAWANTMIERQARHLARIMDDLLDLTRIARGRIELRPSHVDLRDIVSAAAVDFGAMMKAQGISLVCELPQEPVMASVDVTRITQMLGNLLHNAAKYSRKGDNVTVELKRDAMDAVIRVVDSGAGIDAGDLESIFEAFYQTERTRERSKGGLGLGLALVKGIATLHGGCVTAKSEGRGKGACFEVRIPVLKD